MGGEEASGTGAAAGVAGAAGAAGAVGAGDANESKQEDRQRQKQGDIKLLLHLNNQIYPFAWTKSLADMQRGNRRRKQASLHLNCVSTSLTCAPSASTGCGVHVHADTSTMQKLHDKWRLAALFMRKGRETDAVKVKQLNSPVTMSPTGAGSGKGEGPRETAGRSNLPTQAARGRIRERRKPWRSEEQRKALAWQVETQSR